MKRVVMSERQTLFDIALREYGDAAAAWDIAIENDMAITSWKEEIVLLGINDDTPVLSSFINSATNITPESGNHECCENYWEKPDDFPDIKELMENDPIALQYNTCFIALFPNNFLDFDLKYLSNNVDGRFITSDGYDGASCVHQWDATKDISIKSRQYSGVRWVKVYLNINANSWLPEVKLQDVSKNLNAIYVYFYKGNYNTVRVTTNWSLGNQYLEAADCSPNIRYTGQLEWNVCNNLKYVNDLFLQGLTISFNGIFFGTGWNYPIPTQNLTQLGNGIGSFLRDLYRYNHPAILPPKNKRYSGMYTLNYSFYGIRVYTHDIDTGEVEVINNSLLRMPLVRNISLPNVVTLNSQLNDNYSLENISFGGRHNAVSNPATINGVILNFTSMPSLTRESIVNLSNALIDRAELNTHTITIMSIVWNRLSAEEKTILPNKNYTINIVEK